MEMVHENLFVSNQEDYENGNFNKEEWSIVLAAKEPFHRQALGYTGRAAAKDNPEYLYAKRDNKLILNLVDAPKSIFFDKGLIDLALDFIDEELNGGKKVLIVCNQGESRSTSLSLLYLVKKGLINGDTLEEVEAEFLKLYPKYNPGTGMRGFVKENWHNYNTPF
ncbi:MAG TPA: dual specificity protein phosphatase family protein [Epulopiscium sp.]|nr:dual specificity protein phosphatase family protein [Candidatus Epulonipiscium sp.]